MTKFGAFGATLSAGIQQVETAVITGTCTGSGNLHCILTSDSVAGSPLTTAVAILDTDTSDTVATKIAAALNLVAAITVSFKVEASGPNVIFTRLIAATTDADLNLEVHHDTGTGINTDATSNGTTAGVAPVNIAQITNIGGPGLTLDTEDVTTHDQATAWETVVATILRTGEMTLDIVYDPAGATHYYAAGGILYRLANKQYTWFDLTFSSTYDWKFSGYITAFEPGAPVEGALTATVGIKITGAPTLE